jgi:hypothetical protein
MAVCKDIRGIKKLLFDEKLVEEVATSRFGALLSERTFLATVLHA